MWGDKAPIVVMLDDEYDQEEEADDRDDNDDDVDRLMINMQKMPPR